MPNNVKTIYISMKKENILNNVEMNDDSII